MSDIVIDYNNVDIDRAERQVLKGVTFTLGRAEFCYLVGRVGSGKSSLMKTMYADVPVASAERARVLDYDVDTIRRRDIPYLRREIGIVFQDFQLLQDRSVNANLRFVLEATGWKRRGDMEDRIHEVLDVVGMANKSYKMPHELSGGEQQRIVIARALLNKPQLILADEPTGNLDPETGRNIVELLHSLVQRGHTVLMATHNLQLVDRYPGRVMECHDHRLIMH
ncbi:MAG TPA: phosphonate ABC transporter ATP-binding protein [Porphyromonadaceae bacterium]|nr:phosphonate ABC transporter ATP-binding protein [Porphyromonadaceae bacterium]